MDPLPLLAESLALLPPDRRWTVTFSTYFNKLPPGVECQWRCVVDGSPEVISCARPWCDYRLVQAACRAVTPLVQVARTGAATTAARPARCTPRLGRTGPATRSLSNCWANRPWPQRHRRCGGIDAVAVVTRGDESPLDVARRAGHRHCARRCRAPPSPRAFQRKPKSHWPIFAALSATWSRYSSSELSRRGWRRKVRIATRQQVGRRLPAPRRAVRKPRRPRRAAQRKRGASATRNPAAICSGFRKLAATATKRERRAASECRGRFDEGKNRVQLHKNARRVEKADMLILIGVTFNNLQERKQHVHELTLPCLRGAWLWAQED